MRSSSIITIVLMVGLVFAIFTSIMVDFQSQYENDIDNSSWEGFYNEQYTLDINESASRLQADLEEISDEDNWFTNVAQGVIAIPNAILSIFSIIIASVVNAGTILIEAQNVFGLPTAVVVFFNIGLIIIVLFSLINWWHSRTPA